MDLANAASRNKEFKGAKIRTDDGLNIKVDKVSTRFTQTLHVFDPHGQTGAIQFIAGKEVRGSFSIGGVYPADNANEYAIMRKGTTLTNTELILDGGVAYKGSVEIESFETREGQGEYTFSASCKFTGVINDDEANYESGDSGDSGDVSFGKQASGFSEQFTRGYQDERRDRATYPFIIEGLDEDVVNLWDALDTAILTLNNTYITQRGPSGSQLYVETGVVRWGGRGVAVGTLMYGRGPRDCSPAPYASVSIGYTTRGTQTEDVINSGDSGDSGNFCETEGIGIQVRRRYKNRVALKIYRVPGVWTTDPAQDTNMDRMIMRINSNTFTLNSDSKAAKWVRFDGVTAQAFNTPNGPLWSGYLTFAEMVDGWRDNKLTCIKYQALPLEGNQTVPSYTLVANSIWLYRYPATTFSDLNTLIPDCGY